MIPVCARYLLLAVLAAPLAGEAAIVLANDLGLPGSADGFNLTQDTSTGLEWLDLDVSVGRSFADLSGADGTDEFAPGGDFEGFRYATRLELTGATGAAQADSLYKSLGIPPSGFTSPSGYALARALITVAGCFGSCAEYGYSNGTLLDDDGVTPGQASMEAFLFGTNYGQSVPFGSPSLFPPNDAFALLSGNWLVRDIAAVPLPAPAWLLFASCALLTRRVRPARAR